MATQTDDKPPEPTPEPKAASTPTPEPKAGAGEYVVVADQLVAVTGTGKDATSRTYRYGDTVKLDAAQARRFTGGTRPAVVRKSVVRGGDVETARLRSLRDAATARAKRRGSR